MLPRTSAAQHPGPVVEIAGKHNLAMRARPVPSAIAMLALLGLTVAAWALGLRGEFQFDDVPNIVLDRATSDSAVLWQRLGNGFRPLLRLSYAADHALWGIAPLGFLATDLLLHLATVWAVWRLAGRRLPTARAALIAALLFALQPAHAAVVASASGRSTGLSTLLIACALLAHERAFESQRASQATRWTGASLLLFALAVAAKEVALVFPAVLLLWEATRDARPSMAASCRRSMPAVVSALVIAAVAFALSPRLREIVAYSLALGTARDAMATHAAALPYSLSLWFRPWALTIEHAPLPAGAWLPGAAALLAMLAGAVWASRRGRPVLTLALLWPLVMLLPTHSVLARLDPVVEKALYPAWIGPCLGLGWVLDRAFTRWMDDEIKHWRRITATVSISALLLCCAWRAARWSDPPALWREATEHAPQSARAWHNRALTEMGARHFDDAASSIERAQALDGVSSRSHDLALAISLMRPPPTPTPRPATHSSPNTTETPP